VVYVVEFNSGRKDHYHYTDTLKIGDLVIVEADRGRDLGKIASASMPLEKIKKKNEGSDEEKHIKRIYRQATPDEVSLLLTKKHDEQLALEVCLQKINTRNLPMDVVDAEYQW
jgi:cell fate regulator YaaT (PSP1 superfamily)